MPALPAREVPQDDVRSFRRCNGFDAGVPQCPQVNPFKQPFSAAKQHGCDGNVQLIDKALAQVLLDGVRAAANAHVQCAGRLACPFKRVVNAARDEMERRAAFHRYGWTCMVRQDENRHVVGRTVAPPAFPVQVWPGPTVGAEHVPPQNPGPKVLKATRGKVIVNPGRAAVVPEQRLLQRAGWKQPLVQIRPANAQRVVDVLVWPRAVAIERDGEAFNADACRVVSLFGYQLGSPRIGVEGTALLNAKILRKVSFCPLEVRRNRGVSHPTSCFRSRRKRRPRWSQIETTSRSSNSPRWSRGDGGQAAVGVVAVAAQAIIEQVAVGVEHVVDGGAALAGAALDGLGEAAQAVAGRSKVVRPGGDLAGGAAAGGLHAGEAVAVGVVGDGSTTGAAVPVWAGFE